MKKTGLLIAAILIIALFALPSLALEGKSGPYSYTVKPNGELCITKYDWSMNGNEDIFIPRFIDGYTVTEIGDWAFSDKNTMNDFTIERSKRKQLGNKVSLVLPDTITSIGESAFFYTNINKLNTISANVRYIGYGAFSGTNIPEFSVASGNQYYASIDGTLYNKKDKELLCANYQAKTITIPKGIVSIAPYAFSSSPYYYNWQTVTYPETLTSIKHHAFYNAYLHSLYNRSHRGDYGIFLEENIRSIGEYTFYGCLPYRDDNKVDLTNSSIITIPSYAFASLRIDKLYLPQNVTKIDDYAFFDARDIRTINIPASVISIGNHAFHVDEFSKKYDTCDIVFVSSSELQSIGDYAFANIVHRFSNYFFELKLPSSLKRIGSNAFMDWNSEYTLYLPSSLDYIGDNAFHRDQKLSADDGSYAAFWANNNGYTVVNPEGDDTSWLLD